MDQLETTLNILAHTTGPRAPVPECQRQYWSGNAGELIDAYAAHFASLLRDDPLVAALTQSQSWGPQVTIWTYVSRNSALLPISSP